MRVHGDDRRSARRLTRQPSPDSLDPERVGELLAGQHLVRRQVRANRPVGDQQRAVEGVGAVDIVQRDQRRACQRSPFQRRISMQPQHPIGIEVRQRLVEQQQRAAAAPGRGRAARAPARRSTAGRPAVRPGLQARAARSIRRRAAGRGREGRARSRRAPRIGQAISREAGRKVASLRPARGRDGVDRLSPSIIAAPALVSIPASARNRLVLPPPLGPMTATSWPGRHIEVGRLQPARDGDAARFKQRRHDVTRRRIVTTIHTNNGVPATVVRMPTGIVRPAGPKRTAMSATSSKMPPIRPAGSSARPGMAAAQPPRGIGRDQADEADRAAHRDAGPDRDRRQRR